MLCCQEAGRPAGPRSRNQPSLRHLQRRGQGRRQQDRGVPGGEAGPTAVCNPYEQLEEEHVCFLVIYGIYYLYSNCTCRRRSPHFSCVFITSATQDWLQSTAKPTQRESTCSPSSQLTLRTRVKTPTTVRDRGGRHVSVLEN